MTLSVLEKVLDSCYPVSSGIIGFLTAPELAKLLQTSKTVKGSLEKTPPSSLSFLPQFSDLLWASYIDKYGFAATKRIHRHLRGRQTWPVALQAYARAEGMGMKRILAWRDHPSLGLRSLRELYLDGTAISASFVRDLLWMPEIATLQLLSVTGCNRVDVGTIIYAVRDRKWNRGNNLKKLNIWNTVEVVTLAWTEANIDLDEPFRLSDDTPQDFPALRKKMADSILLLGSLFELDTTFCKNHAKNESAFAPAHVMALTCLECGDTKKSEDCVGCLLQRTCESCQGYYCPSCSPWPRGDETDILALVEVSARETRSSDSGDEEYTCGEGEHRAIIRQCCTPLQVKHKGLHRFHKICHDKLPESSLDLVCKPCGGQPCHWQERYGRCGHCRGIICDTCAAEGEEVMFCHLCNGSFCKEPLEFVNSGVQYCANDHCEFWMCEECKTNGGSDSADGDEFNFESGYCKFCHERNTGHDFGEDSTSAAESEDDDDEEHENEADQQEDQEEGQGEKSE